MNIADQTQQQLAAFLHHLTTQKRVSSHTHNAYQRDLAQLTRYCTDHALLSWNAVQTADLRNHIINRHKQGISGKSLQRELSAIRSFYRYLEQQQQVEHNPATQVRAPKPTKKLPKLLDVDQLAGILERPTDSPLEIRDLAMFELLYSSGLRLSELVASNTSDLDLSAGWLRVQAGKGGKPRDVPIGRKAIAAIKNWLAVRPTPQQPTETPLFTSKQGTRLGQRNIQLRLAQWCKKQGIPEAVHPHMLRHSCASHLLESSRDIRAVQELLGHNNISSTQIYTHLDFQHLAAVYDQTHPKAKLSP